MAGLQGRQTDFVLPYAAVATADIPIGQLQPSPHHPRRASSDSELESLADSLRQHGQLTPLLVRHLGNDQYEIIAGVRRWRAAQLAGLEAFRCQVFAADEDQAFVLSLVENLQRQQLTPLEEAQGYQELLDRGIVHNRAGIARMVGVTRMRITQRMKLLELDPVTQRKLAEYHGRLLWEVKDLTARHGLAEKAIEKRWSSGRLRMEVAEWLRDEEIDHWLSGDRSSPRAYSVSLPGFNASLSFERADLYQVDEALDRLKARERAVIATQGEESVPAL